MTIVKPSDEAAQKKSAIIAVDVRRFGHAINTDEVFGTHKATKLALVVNLKTAKVVGITVLPTLLADAVIE